LSQIFVISYGKPALAPMHKTSLSKWITDDDYSILLLIFQCSSWFLDDKDTARDVWSLGLKKAKAWSRDVHVFYPGKYLTPLVI